MTKFDSYAADYERLHAASIAASGEPTTYFTAYKLHCLQRLGITAEQRVLDYGCGTGNLLEHLAPAFHEVHGFDPSSASLDVARDRSPRATLHNDQAAVPADYFDVAVLSGVLHHIPVAERKQTLRTVRTKLRPGGRLFVFEHNPFNPLTRRAVAACPFDDDAILLKPNEARALLRSAGFSNVRLDYIVFFPKLFASLRSFEPRLRWLPLGAQTLTIGTNSLSLSVIAPEEAVG